MKQILMSLLLLGLIGCSVKQPGSVYDSTKVWDKSSYDQYSSFSGYQSYIKHKLKPVWEKRFKNRRVTPSEYWTKDSIVNALVPEDGEIDVSCKNQSHGTVLLLHGLYDSPFVMKDMGAFFNQQCFKTRFLLLPAHGTQPGDMLRNNREQWVEAVDYAVSTIKESDIYIAGFSTGGALAINKALQQNSKVKGLFLFAPLLNINWTRVTGANIKGITGFVQKKTELDTFKYESTSRNSVLQANKLANCVRRELKKTGLTIPVFLSAAANDYTLPTKTAFNLHKDGFFGKESYFVLFAPEEHFGLKPEKCDVVDESTTMGKNERTLVCNSRFSFKQADREYQVNDFSHMSLTLKPDNPHYGLGGSYSYCLHYSGDSEQECKQQRWDSLKMWGKQVCYGERSMLSAQYAKEGACSDKESFVIRRLTSNPRFEFLTGQMKRFIDTRILSKKH